MKTATAIMILMVTMGCGEYPSEVDETETGYVTGMDNPAFAPEVDEETEAQSTPIPAALPSSSEDDDDDDDLIVETPDPHIGDDGITQDTPPVCTI